MGLGGRYLTLAGQNMGGKGQDLDLKDRDLSLREVPSPQHLIHIVQIVWSTGNFLMGVAMLVGPPVCGYLHDTYDAYQPMFILNAAFILITSVFLFEYEMRV